MQSHTYEHKHYHRSNGCKFENIRKHIEERIIRIAKSRNCKTCGQRQERTLDNCKHRKPNRRFGKIKRRFLQIKRRFFGKNWRFFLSVWRYQSVGCENVRKKTAFFQKKSPFFFGKSSCFLGVFKLGCSRKRIYFFPGYFPPQRKRSDQYFSSKRLIVTPFEVDACMNVSLSIKIPTWLVLPPGTLLKKTKSPSLIV